VGPVMKGKGLVHELRAGEEATITNIETGARVWFYAVARQRIVVPYGFRLETCASVDKPVASPRCQDAGACGQHQVVRRPSLP
jgi:hypothetical protein